MQITTTIPLTPDEEIDLARIFGCPQPQLANVIARHATAAVTEYLAMYRGQKVLKRGTDILEYRLFLLICTALGNEIPDEQTVSNLFQTTLTESRGLVRAVISKYQYQVREAVRATMTAKMSNLAFDQDANVYTIVLNSANIVDELNRLLAGGDGTLTPVVRRRGSVSTYEIRPSAYELLCRQLNIVAREDHLHD